MQGWFRAVHNGVTGIVPGTHLTDLPLASLPPASTKSAHVVAPMLKRLAIANYTARAPDEIRYDASLHLPADFHDACCKVVARERA